jgi:hypothetical protein
MNKKSNNKRIFEVLWTVDAFFYLSGEHPLWKTPEIAGKPRISRYP